MEEQTLWQTEGHNALVSLVKKNRAPAPKMKIYKDCLEKLCDNMIISVVYLYWT